MQKIRYLVLGSSYGGIIQAATSENDEVLYVTSPQSVSAINAAGSYSLMNRTESGQITRRVAASTSAETLKNLRSGTKFDVVVIAMQEPQIDAAVGEILDLCTKNDTLTLSLSNMPLPRMVSGLPGYQCTMTRMETNLRPAYVNWDILYNVTQYSHAAADPAAIRPIVNDEMSRTSLRITHPANFHFSPPSDQDHMELITAIVTRFKHNKKVTGIGATVQENDIRSLNKPGMVVTGNISACLEQQHLPFDDRTTGRFVKEHRSTGAVMYQCCADIMSAATQVDVLNTTDSRNYRLYVPYDTYVDKGAANLGTSSYTRTSKRIVEGKEHLQTERQIRLMIGIAQCNGGSIPDPLLRLRKLEEDLLG